MLINKVRTNVNILQMNLANNLINSLWFEIIK